MIKINKTSWGKVVVNDQKYHQVLIVGSKVIPRDTDKLNQLFKTTHQIGDWEQKLLMNEQPDIILIANGWSGALKVSEDFKNKLVDKKIALKTILTPKVVKEYRLLLKKGKQVNVLIHTTC